jgi:hypothetical protein
MRTEWGAVVVLVIAFTAPPSAKHQNLLAIVSKTPMLSTSQSTKLPHPIEVNA